MKKYETYGNGRLLLSPTPLLRGRRRGRYIFADGSPGWLVPRDPGLIAFPELFAEARRARRSQLPAASVNNSAAKMSCHKHQPGFLLAGKTRIAWLRLPGLDVSTSDTSPSSQALRWSPTNTQWRTALVSRSHYKPFDGISQRVFATEYIIEQS